MFTLGNVKRLQMRVCVYSQGPVDPWPAPRCPWARRWLRRAPWAWATLPGPASVPAGLRACFLRTCSPVGHCDRARSQVWQCLGPGLARAAEWEPPLMAEPPPRSLPEGPDSWAAAGPGRRPAGVGMRAQLSCGLVLPLQLDPLSYGLSEPTKSDSHDLGLWILRGAASRVPRPHLLRGLSGWGRAGTL